MGTDDATDIVCEACVPGTAKSTSDRDSALRCENCAQGKYAVYTATSTCTDCSANKDTDAVGHDHMSDCKVLFTSTACLNALDFDVVPPQSEV